MVFVAAAVVLGLACLATGGAAEPVDAASAANGHNSLQPGTGPNVCRSRYSYCCPGWKLKPGTALCIIPICTRACSAGRCIKPNICLCDGGTVASTCPPSAGGAGAGPAPGSHHHYQPQPQPQPQPPPGAGGCAAPCLHGGSCVSGRCVCRPGFTGEFCAEPVCSEPCQNGGRCIVDDRCACVYGFTGRWCEADYRTGPCFTRVRNDMCQGQLEGVVCTRQLCCATVGVAWGHPCEKCPSHLDCDEGFIKNLHSGQCVDVDECEAIPGLCQGGRCTNSVGSFTCECPEGQTRNPETNECRDRDECLEEDICTDGRCVNTDGSYYCLCNPGFIPSQDNKHCRDARQGNCYTALSRRGHCRNPLPMKLSKQDCCCGMNMGKGWGDACDICPAPGEEAYTKLCRMPGPIVQGIDECGLRPDICGPGKCIDTPDGYRCECHPGYRKGMSEVCEG